MQKIIIGILVMIILAGGGYYFWSNKENNIKAGLVNNNNAKINKDKDVKNLEKKEEKENEKASQDKSLSEKDGEIKKEIKKVSQKTLLILDASGSMWEKVNGEAKITIAKRVIKDTLKDFNDIELGLIAYGHREKGNCKDIEILSDPQKNNASNISGIVDGISPKGNTPMGASVLMAAESLRYTEEKATVILVSDGIETCGVDLCKLGKTLEETGVDFTAHVIGFGMTLKQTAGLKCLAEETGGEFVSAKDSNSLSDALKKAVEKSACSKEKLGEAIITIPTEVSAGSTFEVSFTGPKKENDFITIVPKGSIDINEHLDYFYHVNESKLRAPVKAGKYDVVYFASCGTVLGRTPLIIREVLAKIIAPTSISIGSKFNIEFTGPKNESDFVALMPKGSTNTSDNIDYFYPVNDPELEAPVDVGEYDIVYWLNGDKELTRTSVRTTMVTASLSAPASVTKETSFSIEFTGPKNESDFVALMPKGSTDIDGRLDYFYPVNDPELNSPNKSGEYDIVYWLNGEREIARTSISVK